MKINSIAIICYGSIPNKRPGTGLPGNDQGLAGMEFPWAKEIQAACGQWKCKQIANRRKFLLYGFPRK